MAGDSTQTTTTTTAMPTTTETGTTTTNRRSSPTRQMPMAVLAGPLRFCAQLQTQQMLKCCVLYGIVLLLVPDFIVALKDVSVTIPQAVKRGSNALLQCNYDMENDTLYSVKWYKGRREFYRYTPKENPAMKVFAMASGLNVERNLSNQSHVVLLAVPLNISGKFTCEISVEAPSFQTAMVSGEMEVVELPEEPTTVTGIQQRYRIGDLVDGNCSIKFSKPAANLTWTINGIVVPPHHIKNYQIEKHEDRNLESVVSAVHFMVTTTHFLKGQMRLKCTASIFDIFKEEIESVIEEDRPRIMASGRSYDINNYPYEQHSSGDGFEDHNESYLTYYSAADITSSSGRMRPSPVFLWLHSMHKGLLHCVRQVIGDIGKMAANSKEALATLVLATISLRYGFGRLEEAARAKKCHETDETISQLATGNGYAVEISGCCQRLSSTATPKAQSSSSSSATLIGGRQSNWVMPSMSPDQTLLMAAYTRLGEAARSVALQLC